VSYRVFEKFPGYSRREALSFVRMKLRTSDAWAQKALLTLFDKQTDNEKRNHISIEDNNWGFGSFDAPMMTCLVYKVKRGTALNSEQKEKIRTRIWHYAVQIILLCDRNKMTKALDGYYQKLNLKT